jgi:hypothetical protein
MMDASIMERGSMPRGYCTSMNTLLTGVMFMAHEICRATGAAYGAGRGLGEHQSRRSHYGDHDGGDLVAGHAAHAMEIEDWVAIEIQATAGSSHGQGQFMDLGTA